jgi:hypothetical protein
MLRPQGERLAAATESARRRCEARNVRIARADEEKLRKLVNRRAASLEARKSETIQRAIDRARERLARRNT